MCDRSHENEVSLHMCPIFVVHFLRIYQSSLPLYFHFQCDDQADTSLYIFERGQRSFFLYCV